MSITRQESVRQSLPVMEFFAEPQQQVWQKKNRPKVPRRNLKNHKKPSQTDDTKQDDHKNMIAASQSSIPAAEADWPQSDTQGHFPQFRCKN